MPAVLNQPSRIIRQAVNAEAQLRPEYLRFDTNEVQDLANGVQLADLLVKSWAFLRALLAGACAVEVLDAFRAGGNSAPDFPEVVRRVRTKCGLEPGQVVSDVERHFETIPTPKGDHVVSLHAALRAVKATLTACPIDQLQAAAIERDMAPLGHECRLAYDGLRAFVLRTDPTLQARVRVVGEAYQGGALSVGQAALVLGWSRADTAAELESHGYARPLPEIRLNDDRRAQLLAVVRRAREEDPRTWRSPTEDETTRHVIASERIEGIDARRWL